jgi:hypothetical protein
MTESSSVDQASPELEALEAFLGDNPEELVAFTETPFGALLNRANELGFDGDLIQAELSSTGVLDVKAWIGPVGIERDEFLALTPLEYADRYPEHGAPLVAALLNSIHLSDEQASLHAVAGGTNLSKGEKIGIGVAAAVITGVYVVPRLIGHLKLRSLLVKEAVASRDMMNHLAEYGVRGDFGVAKLEADFLGIKHMNITANSFSSRLKMEWNMSLMKYIYKFKPDPKPEPKPERRSISDDISIAESHADEYADHEVREALSQSLLDDMRNSSGINNNIERGIDDPSRELNDLAGDMRDAADLSRPKSMEVINNKLDALAVEGLEREAKTVLGSLDLDPLAEDIKSQASNFVNTELDAARQELEGIKASVESNIDEDLQTVKSDVSSEIDQAVSEQEKILIDEVDTAKKEVDQAIKTDANDFKDSVERRVEAVVADVDEGIGGRM